MGPAKKAKKTTNHDETRKRAGSGERQRKPAPIDFGDKDKKPEKTNWDGFLKKFDESGIKFLYSPERRKRFNK